MSDFGEQLHLPLERPREPTLEHYLPGPNAEALAVVAAMASGTGPPFALLFGRSGTGKTHLLQAACLDAVQRGRPAAYVPLGGVGLTPEILENLERLHLVAVDDVQRIAGDPDWEGALFDLFNRVREQGRSLLAAARAAPDDLNLNLPDLRSRLHWGPRYRLLPLNDAECDELLSAAARQRGLVLGAGLRRYIMRYHARDPASLLELMARLDSLSLRERQPPALPLLRRLMGGPERGGG